MSQFLPKNFKKSSWLRLAQRGGPKFQNPSDAYVYGDQLSEEFGHDVPNQYRSPDIVKNINEREMPADIPYGNQDAVTNMMRMPTDKVREIVPYTKFIVDGVTYVKSPQRLNADWTYYTVDGKQAVCLGMAIFGGLDGNFYITKLLPVTYSLMSFSDNLLHTKETQPSKIDQFIIAKLHELDTQESYEVNLANVGLDMFDMVARVAQVDKLVEPIDVYVEVRGSAGARFDNSRFFEGTVPATFEPYGNGRLGVSFNIKDIVTTKDIWSQQPQIVQDWRVQDRDALYAFNDAINFTDVDKDNSTSKLAVINVRYDSQTQMYSLRPGGASMVSNEECNITVTYSIPQEAHERLMVLADTEPRTAQRGGPKFQDPADAYVYGDQLSNEFGHDVPNEYRGPGSDGEIVLNPNEQDVKVDTSRFDYGSATYRDVRNFDRGQQTSLTPESKFVLNGITFFKLGSPFSTTFRYYEFDEDSSMVTSIGTCKITTDGIIVLVRDNPRRFPLYETDDLRISLYEDRDVPIDEIPEFAPTRIDELAIDRLSRMGANTDQVIDMAQAGLDVFDIVSKELEEFV